MSLVYAAVSLGQRLTNASNACKQYSRNSSSSADFSTKGPCINGTTRST